MESEHPESLIERVSRLEKELEELKTAFTTLHVAAEKPTVEPKPEPDPEPEVERVRTFRVVEKPPKKGGGFKAAFDVGEEVRSRIAWKSEDWLNKIGIGLLLVGVLFLFKYSVDQGWIVPSLRAAFGFVLGIGMLYLGFRLRESRVQLGRVLMGGSIAVFRIETDGTLTNVTGSPFPAGVGTFDHDVVELTQ